jgi:CheY-like chemotaxis protein
VRRFAARSFSKGVFHVSLRILFADDSMTAQNMGKKILTEAGYEVVAVSNGAAAVKKIAEQKPDIIILDVYMPGYSGLEVCEKVRASLDTMKTPVLLTVGKMEPYKPEDANRVKADGVIIKPFEASDLLAIMKKFEERIAQTAVPPMVQQTVRLEREYQEEAIAAAEPVEHHSTGKTGMQPMVEVPDHMAGAAAFNDMLSADSSMAAHHFGVSSPAAAFETSVIVPAPPIPTAEYELPVSWKEEEKPEPIATVPAETEPEIVATPVEAAAEPVPTEAEPETVAMEALPDPEASVIPEASEVSSAGDVSQPSHPQFIPVYKEPEPEATSYEVLPTGAPPTGDLEIPREPELQETANEATRNTIADRVEPGLLSPQEKYSVDEKEPAPSWSSGSSTATTAEAAPAPTMEVSPSEADLAPLPAIRASGEVSDIDFEARVAAAMAAYSHATEATPAPPEVHESPIAVVAEVPAETSYTAQPVEAAPATEAAPSFEYHPPVRVPEVPETAPTASVDVAAAAPEITAVPIPATPVPSPQAHETVTLEPAAVHDVVTAGVEAAAVAAATETGADHHNIAQAIHRVMERLKPELVEEIMRELRSKK